MSEKQVGIIDVGKALTNVSLVVLAAAGSASGNVPLATIPAGLLAVFQTVGPLREHLGIKQDKDLLELPPPIWWSEKHKGHSIPEWQGLCKEIENHLSEILKAMKERLQREPNVVTTQVVQKAFIDSLANEPLIWESDPLRRKEVANYIVEPLLQKLSEILKVIVEPINRDKLLQDVDQTSVNTTKMVSLLEQIHEQMRKMGEQKPPSDKDLTNLSTTSTNTNQTTPVQIDSSNVVVDKPHIRGNNQTSTSTTSTKINQINPVQSDKFIFEADKFHVVTEPRINTPSINIFLGSTSSLSALELMRHMHTLSPDDRKRVALVYIDTDSAPEAVIEFRHKYLSMFQEFPLHISVPTSISHRPRISQPLSNPSTAHLDKELELHTFIKGKEPQYFSGAGGIRNNGHVAACFHHHAIYDTLDGALATVTHIDPFTGDRRASTVHVNIVAFLGGGTGSGILPDIVVMVHELLRQNHHDQRTNLFCMLPEPVRKASQEDLMWRKSNATACLLELLAYSSAARSRNGRYNKYMRDKIYQLGDNAIASEVYLIGHSSMGDVKGTARIVGLDLFQRVTDASGVGELERTKFVERALLRGTDEKDLPKMFGTSYPLEVSFPAFDTADAFARISAVYLLPLLASYQPQTISVSEVDKIEWLRKWKNVASVDANSSNPQSIQPGVFSLDEFTDVDLDQLHLDYLWEKLVLKEEETERKIADVIAVKRTEEMKRIHSGASTIVLGIQSSLINSRIQHLQRCRQEYSIVLDSLNTQGIPVVPSRPIDIEANLIHPRNWFHLLPIIGRNYTNDVYRTYNERLEAHAWVTRHHLLKDLLLHLLQSATKMLNSIMSWLQDAQVSLHQQKLENEGMTSAAWQGKLNAPHSYQRHIFDLPSLRSREGHNTAVEGLYTWATGGEQALNQGIPIDYNNYVKRFIDYLRRHTKDTSADAQVHLEHYSGGHLADRAVDFFRDYYEEKFRDINLIELFDKATMVSPERKPRDKYLSELLAEHVQYLLKFINNLIIPEEERWIDDSSNLETSIFLGIHLRDAYQHNIFQMALNSTDSLIARGHSVYVETAIDPHSLQMVYGHHGISLSMIKDFYLDQNSSMSAYLYNQKKWEDVGSDRYGHMPVHSCSEVEFLVRDGKAMGYQLPLPLYERVIRYSL